MPHSTLLKPVQRPRVRSRHRQSDACKAGNQWSGILDPAGVVGNLVFVQVIHTASRVQFAMGLSFTMSRPVAWSNA